MRRPTKRRFSLLFLIFTFALVIYHFEFPDPSSKDPSYLQPGILWEEYSIQGLGNQMFRYACSYALAKTLGVPLYAVATSGSAPKLKPKDFHHLYSRPYLMQIFNISYTRRIVGSLNSPKFTPLVRLRDSDILKNEDDNPLPTDQFMVVDDFCESYIYFRDFNKDIIYMFQLQALNEDEEYLERETLQYWKKQIGKAGSHSVSVHIRRGDFPEAWRTPISFFQMAMKKIMEIDEKSVFFVFSDDLNDIQGKLLNDIQVPLSSIHMVSCKPQESCTTYIEDFYLMTLCKHDIISTSTFSWWAAYLNKNPKKVIFAPKPIPKILQAYEENVVGFKKLEINVFYPREWRVFSPIIGPMTRTIVAWKEIDRNRKTDMNMMDMQF